MLRKRKGQIGVQFMIAIAMSFMVLIILIANIAGRYSTITEQDAQVRIKDIGLKVREELILAASSQSIYERTFLLPVEVLAKPYNISHQGQFLSVEQGDQDFITIVPNFNGTLVPGWNNVTKDEEGICVNC